MAFSLPGAKVARASSQNLQYFVGEGTHGHSLNNRVFHTMIECIPADPEPVLKKVSYKNYKCGLLLTLVKTCVPADGVASLPKSYTAATPSPHR